MFTITNLTRALVVLAAWTVAAAAAAADGHKASPEKEKELLTILRSEAPAADKAIACKRLAIDGSSAAVPDLAKLLPDKQLSSWARIALEAIPGTESEAALREASKSLEGKLLVGTINSIGVRRDAAAVEILTTRLKDKDPDVASASAVALGRIGNETAAKILHAALPKSATEHKDVRSAVAEGCVLCAERLHAAGKSSTALNLYDEVAAADVPKQRVIEATRGNILLRGEKEGVPLLVELLRSADIAMFRLGLTIAREFPGGELDKALATELASAKPERAALIVEAMADRPKTVVVSAVAKAAESGEKQVRIAAIGALGRVGDDSSVAALLATAVDDDAELSKAAKTTLGELRGEKVNAKIAAELGKAEGKSYPVLIELVAKRRISATPALLRALDHSDKAVRAAALAALGETVELSGLNVLVSEVVAPKHSDQAEVAQRALKAASIRMPDRDACAAQLAAAVEQAKDVKTKITLLEIAAAVEGKKALATIAAAANSDDVELQNAGSRLLGSWSTEDAAPVLLEVAKSPKGKFQVRALRGYIRIARQFVLPDKQRVEMCQKALEAAKGEAEKVLVLDVLKRYPTPEGLDLAIKSMAEDEIKEDATGAALAIAQKLAAKGIDVKERLAKAGIEKVKLEIVKGEYGAGDTQKDVTEVLRKQATDLPVITLSGTYNKTFGGDPAPNTQKKLKIQYRMNGKAGEASFAEDALIILPMPK